MTPSASGASEVASWAPFLQAGFSTVLGGLISAAVAYAMQRRATAERRAEEAERRNDAKKVAARRLVMKLKMIADGIYARHRAIEEGLQEAEQRGLKGPAFALMRPLLAAPPSNIDVDPEEAGLLLEFKEADHLNAYLLLVEGWKHFVHGLGEYEAKRERLFRELGEGTIDSTVGTLRLTEAQARKWGPEIAATSELAGEIRDQAAQLWPLASDLAATVGVRLRDHFGGDPTIPVATRKDDWAAPSRGATP